MREPFRWSPPAAVRCVVDGSILLLHDEDETWESERRCLRIEVAHDALSVGHVRIEEIRPPR